jgi:mannose-6-phosphate isomerase
VQPVLMPPNRLVHYYLGGEAITRLRKVPAPAERSPEEWLASSTTRYGQADIGLSRLPDGQTLAAAVRADPQVWVGPDAAQAVAGDVGVLVKLLDAGERLPVHVHPDRGFARAHLGSCYGKTEAWYVLETSGDQACVYLGFHTDVDAEALRQAVREQDAEWLLRQMNRLSVRSGDVVFVPAGTPHAIGAGAFLLEVQEPTDFSVLLEWQGFGEPSDAFLGLDPDVALQTVDRRTMGAAELASLRRHVPLHMRAAQAVPLMPLLADGFFRADLLAPLSGQAIEVAAGFGVSVVLEGAGRLVAAGRSLPISTGDVLAIPYAAGDWQIAGEVTAALCRPSTPALARETAPSTEGALAAALAEQRLADIEAPSALRGIEVQHT